MIVIHNTANQPSIVIDHTHGVTVAKPTLTMRNATRHELRNLLRMIVDASQHQTFTPARSKVASIAINSTLGLAICAIVT